jgi:hypothetical protein
MAAIVNSVKHSIIMSLSPFKTAKPMWLDLQKRYVQDSGALLHTLIQKIHLIEQNDLSIDEYYFAFDRLMGPLVSMVPHCTADDCPSYKFIEKFFTYRFVMGLRTDFEVICTRLLHGSATLTMSHALSDLLAEETHFQSMTNSHDSVPHSVRAASQRYSGSRGSSLEPCEHCKMTSHRSENYFEKFPAKLADFHARRAAHGRGTGSAPSGSVAAATSPVIASSASWVLNSGASFHVTYDHSKLASSKLVPDGDSIQTADGTLCHITHEGSLCNSYFTVPNIFFVPELSMNLLSVGQITDHNCFVGFDDSSCFVQDRQTGVVIGTGCRRKSAPHLYILDTLRLPSSTPSSAHVLSTASVFTPSFAQWHHCLSHLCGSRLSTLIKLGYLGHTSFKSGFHCKGCKLEKQIQLPYFSSDSYSAKLFDFIHSDVWGSTPFVSKGGHKYYVIFIDNHSRYS